MSFSPTTVFLPPSLFTIPYLKMGGYLPEGPWQIEWVSRQKPPKSHLKAGRGSCIWDKLALCKTLAEDQLEWKPDLEITGESWWTRSGIQVSTAKQQHTYFIHLRMLQILKSESSYWSMTMNLDKHPGVKRWNMTCDSFRLSASQENQIWSRAWSTYKWSLTQKY